MSVGDREHEPEAKMTRNPRRSLREAIAAKRNAAQEDSSKPEDTGTVDGSDPGQVVEDSITDIILQIIGPVAEVIIDAVPNALDTVSHIIDVIGDVVWDITKEVIVQIVREAIEHILEGDEGREALAGLGLEELDASLEGLEALAADPAVRELFAKRMIEAREQGKAFPLPSARELMEYRDGYLRGVTGRQGE